MALSTPNLISAIGSRVYGVMDGPREIQWLHQRIGIAVQHGNTLAMDINRNYFFLLIIFGPGVMV